MTSHHRRFAISRRTFLRGAGVTLGLPWLDAMVPTAHASAVPSGRAPRRLACLFFPNGVWQNDWIPQQTGSDFTLPFSLEPLADLRDDLLILSGLDKAHSRQGDGHYAKTANFLTGMPVEKTTGKNINSGGISLDQLVAQHVGGQTPLPSLELGTESVISGVDSNVGYTRLYGSHISWQSPTRPVAKEINPRLVYERLFGTDGQAPALGGEHQHLLDFVLEDARRLRGRLGRDDQFKFDEYLDAVRAVERRIEFHQHRGAEDWNPQTSGLPAPPAPGLPDDFREHVRLMLDLIVLAFRTDATRVSTLMFANDVSGRNFAFVDGVSGSHHELSHHENKPDRIAQYARIVRWHVEQFADMLRQMKSIQEGDATLLDNSMILFGCGMSDGNRHDPNNLPIIVAGRGGGTIGTGRHLASPKNTPLCNLHLALAHRMGLDIQAFGDSTGELKDLGTES
jgi:hypothetical protein